MSTRSLAPAGLRLVQEFVNTTDIEEGRDDLGSPAQLGAWLRDHALLGRDETPDAGELEAALHLREALRGLLLANNGGPLYPVDLGSLNQAAAQSQLRVRFQGDGAARLDPATPGVPGALGHLLAAAFTAMADGTWPRLKACRKHSCRWAFYDQSKNRSSTWCNMAVCGSRTKAQAYRARQRARIDAQSASVLPSSTPSAQ